MKPKIIYTHHARARIKKRGLSFLGVEQTIFGADSQKPLAAHQVKFIKQQGSRLYHVVANFNPQQNAWIVISAWVRGENDRPALVWRILSWPFRMVFKFLQLLFGWD